LLSGISNSIPTLLGLGVACVAAATASLAGLILWIKVTTPQALKITGSYVGFVIGLSIVLTLVFRPAAA